MFKFNIDDLLKQKNKTRYWLSRETGISYPALKKIADNETTSITFENLYKICNALECDLNTLLKSKGSE